MRGGEPGDRGEVNDNDGDVPSSMVDDSRPGGDDKNCVNGDKGTGVGVELCAGDTIVGIPRGGAGVVNNGTTPTSLGVAPAPLMGVVRLIALFVLGVSGIGGRTDVGEDG